MPGDPLEYLFSLEHFGIKFGLENITALVAALGHPERTFTSVHVAGTNGKGSVTAMIDACLRAAGIRSARYTSPHITSIAERFAIGGQPVCLGGRLDATNVITPAVGAITSIALDHEQYLGRTIPEIAREKAGIAKAGVPLVVGAVSPDAADAISRAAAARGAPVIWAEEGASIRRDPSGLVHARTPAHDYGRFTLALEGQHQLGNALVAIRALEALARSIPAAVAAIPSGLEQVHWPGRLERVQAGGGRDALLDAAHNPAGASALASYLQARAPMPLVFAAMRDKDAEGILRALAPHVSGIVVTRASNPRSADPDLLAAIARRVAPALTVDVAPSAADALRTAWRRSPHIVVAGSIFLLADVVNALKAPC